MPLKPNPFIDSEEFNRIGIEMLMSSEIGNMLYETKPSEWKADKKSLFTLENFNKRIGEEGRLLYLLRHGSCAYLGSGVLSRYVYIHNHYVCLTYIYIHTNL